LLSACAQQGRYRQHQDSPPSSTPKEVALTDAIPKYEPYAPANQRPYTIRGINYTPMTTGKGFSAEGEASWYGQKFHGHLTSNGEAYDMYGMSAAHKTLPLPSYARITNLQNGKQVVVRINDRGPFHRKRLVDLSYAAAMKLGILSTGVGQVKLDVIHIDKDGQLTVGKHQPIDSIDKITIRENESNNLLFIQVAALQDKQKILHIGHGLTSLYQIPHHTPEDNGLYRLQLGPINNEDDAKALLLELQKNGYSGAYKVYLTE
jgi:rare lipoprotein A